ncbi:MAG: DEDD exonuclease domain-containing protein [Actinomycetota bacterium]
MQAVQMSLDEGVPLSEVTFCIVDLETTGGSPASSAITEIGAVKYRGGERLGTFSTLVNPRQPIPPFITHMTGIDDLEVATAPPLEAVVPAFAEFLAGSVFVAHNAGFDLGFVNAAFKALDYDPVAPPPVCTARLARRVVWPDVPNVRLNTLAEYFHCAVRPEHRALPDAEACAEVLHGLLELGGRLGISTLADLRQAVRARGRPHFAKIRLTDHLPRAPGVYIFRSKDQRVLYVGKAKDLRSRVKAYFYGDGRKKVEDLLSELATVEGIQCHTELEALVLEARLVRQYEPKYNRRGKTWRRHAYLKIDLSEAFPRIKVVRETKGADAVFVGPFPSSMQARLAKEALEDAFPIRRCTKPMRATTRFAPCALADMGRCRAPCDGRIDTERYGELVRGLISSLQSPGGLLEALDNRMNHLASMDRFEEAALCRDRLRVLAEALEKGRTDSWLLGSGTLVLREEGGRSLRFVGGALEDGRGSEPIGRPCPRDRAEELSAVRRWLARNPVVVEEAENPPLEQVEGGALLHRLLAKLRAAERGLDYRS